MTKKQAQKSKQTKEQAKKQKGFSALIGVIIVVVLGLGAAVGYYFYDQNTEVEINDQTTNQVTDQKENRETYTNQDHQFSLTFPASWQGYIIESVSFEDNDDDTARVYFYHPMLTRLDDLSAKVRFSISVYRNTDQHGLPSGEIIKQENNTVYVSAITGVYLNAYQEVMTEETYDEINDIIDTFSLSVNAVNTNTTVNQNTNSVVDETADWLTYTNQQYGYFLKYPADWDLLGNCYAGEGLEEQCGDIFINHEEKYIGTGVCANEWQRFGVIIRTTDQDPNQYASDTYNLNLENNYTTSELEIITVDGIEGQQFSVNSGYKTESGYRLECQDTNKMFVIKDNQVYEISYVKDIVGFEQILSTFQFTDPTAEVTSSTIELIDDTWNQYTNYDLGFSINVPVQAWFSDIGCEWHPDQNSYLRTRGFVPVNVYENSSAYIAQEYFAELSSMIRTEDENGVYDTDYAECNRVDNSIEQLEINNRGWEIKTATVTSEDELNDFINANFGEGGCHLGELEVWEHQDGVFEASIERDGLEPEESTCILGYASVILYYPAGNKTVTWDLGQAIQFYARDIMNDSTVDDNLGYDTRMTESFRFLE